MFGALGEYVVSPQIILEDNMILDDIKSDPGHLEEDYQVPTKVGKKKFGEGPNAGYQDDMQ
jgi:hypothetical protein